MIYQTFFRLFAWVSSTFWSSVTVLVNSFIRIVVRKKVTSMTLNTISNVVLGANVVQKGYIKVIDMGAHVTFWWDFTGLADKHLHLFLSHGVHVLDLGWGYVCMYGRMDGWMDGCKSIIDSTVNLDPRFEDRDHYDHEIGVLIGFWSWKKREPGPQVVSSRGGCGPFVGTFNSTYNFGFAYWDCLI